MGGISRREFDQYTEDSDRRLDALEKWRDEHAKEHDRDDENAAAARRWSWQQVTAWAAVAAVLAAAWIGAAGK